jgi:response regulator NasT
MTAARVVIALEKAEARRQLRCTLETLRHQVVGEAGDADTAWRLARQFRPDLVLLSTSLGAGDSFEAAEAIRSGFDLPIFFLSNSYDPVLLDRARQVGCAGFLVAPFTDVALDIALWMALDRHAERQSLRRDLEELKEKLEARKLINRAKAILMEQHGLTEPEAFRRLQAQSMNTAKPMKALAEAIILSARVLEDRPKPRQTTM